MLSQITCIYAQRVHVQNKRPGLQAYLALLFFES